MEKILNQDTSLNGDTKHYDKYVYFIDQSHQNERLISSFTKTRVVTSARFMVALMGKPCDEQPDAVIYCIDKINEEFFSWLNFAKSILTECGIPLIVVAPELDLNDKKKILQNGADDCFTHPVDPAKLNHWINFLRVFKQKSNTEKAELKGNPAFRISPAKRIFDIFVSSSVLLVASPILLLIALLIKLESKGPVFYISKRAGSGYKVINFMKFRSMAQGADKELSKLMHLNQYGGNDKKESKSGVNPVFFKLKDDPRITRFGSFLRMTSLDELPQLINVLKGDMSIVGNRPLPLYEAQQLTQDQIALRFMAPAGITGLWQVTKRGKADMSEEERIKLDMIYARKNSLFEDFKIILRTIPALMQKEKV